MFKLAVFASGKGSNFEAIVKYFHNNKNIVISSLICDQPKAYAIEIAKKNNIETFVVECTKFKTKLEPEQEDRVVKYLISKNIDLVVLAGYMRIIKTPLLKAFAGRIINIHPSLLPSFKGLNAVQQALDYGVKITGCTVHYVDNEIDNGKIIDQKSVYIDHTDNVNSLHMKIHEQEHLLYPKTIESIALSKK
ncbi:MAG: Phosphoribosylglycinamide formyltransferase [uncultured bacterium]|nr:MAG: Phosphoribosylglycinamide formyltransferase [uncultured bacterium]